ncbi:MAG: type II toxin-antitoxin system RelE/ParE family toxin [Clostridia bacterium]|nr:type II toxin-antitoxin system RelE/ParE family toxin [Clostridia bacterium]
MYSINFYRDKDGNEPIIEYLKKLRKRNDKNSRINLNKINDYIEALSKYGTYLGEPYIKHLDGEIWELRPLKNRIMFFGYDGKQFVLLSHFIKKTQKTPKREIDKAKRLMKDYLERNEEK